MPVSPPMPNIGRNAVAKSIGTLKRMEPPQSEMKNALRMMTEGMEMIRVVVWKNALTAEPMPVSHMRWAQTKNGRRIQVIPFARSWMIVAMKLIAPRSDDVMRKINPTSQSVWPFMNG